MISYNQIIASIRSCYGICKELGLLLGCMRRISLPLALGIKGFASRSTSFGFRICIIAVRGLC